MAFKCNKHGQICSKCKQEIQIHEDISWNRKNSAEVWHITCPTEKAPELPADFPPVGHSNLKAGDYVRNYEHGFEGQVTRIELDKEKSQLNVVFYVGIGIYEGQKYSSYECRLVKIDGPTSMKPTKNKPEEKPMIPKSVTAEKEKVEHSDRATALEQALRQFVSMDADKVREIVKAEIKESPITSRELTVTVDNLPKVNVGIVHEQFDKLLKLACIRNQDGNKLNIYLHGGAGSGKSTGAHKLAKALNLEYGFTSLNPQTPESRLLGFIHANGGYVETEFFKRYTQGGVFCLDEVDNASSSLITTLNSLLENGAGAFPHGIHQRHKDFICVCTANTIGRGGNINYPERRALDGAFLDRFHFLEWGYDTKLIESIVFGILGAEKGKTFISNVDEIKENVSAKYPTLIISPRSYIQGAGMLKSGWAMSDIVDAVILRGLKNK